MIQQGIIGRRGALAIWAAGLLAAIAAAGPSRAADPAYGEYLSSACATCHRADGADKGIPSIVGWPEEQFVVVLNAYKTKERSNPVMQTIAGRLSDDEMAALAAYYGALKAK